MQILHTVLYTFQDGTYKENLSELLEFAIILSILMYFVLDLGVILFGRARPSLGQRDKASNVSFRNSLR